MEGPRAARICELQMVIDLINLIFRINNNMAPTMEEEFPLLLCKDNIDNIRVIVDNGKPVSDINYYKTNIHIEGSIIKAASIGAVCTHPDCRGRNLATSILDDVEERLKDDGIDIMLVSGDRGLYLRRGCTIVGGFVRSTLNNFENNFFKGKLVEYDKKYLPVMARIYSQESTRFHRSLYEFENILRGSTVSWSKYTYKIYLISNNGRMTGYIIVQCRDGKTRTGSLIEYAGDRKDICSALMSASKTLDLSEMAVYASKYDPINAMLEEMGAKVENFHQQGTVKIINYTSFMDRLRPYFAQYLPHDIDEALRFSEDRDTYKINVLGEEIAIEGQNALNYIIFGETEEGKIGDELVKAINNKPHVKQFIDSVFPLPFPWTANLNYI